MNLKLRKEQKTNLLGWVFFFFPQLVKSSLAASGSPPPAPRPPTARQGLMLQGDQVKEKPEPIWLGWWN